MVHFTCLLLGNGMTEGLQFLGYCLAVFAIGVVALLIAVVCWLKQTPKRIDVRFSVVACLAVVGLTVNYVGLGRMLQGESLQYFLLAASPALLALLISFVRRWDLD